MTPGIVDYASKPVVKMLRKITLKASAQTRPDPPVEHLIPLSSPEPRPHSFINHHLNHLQWRRRTLAALPEALSPSLAPVVSPSSAPATLQSPSSPGSCPVALNFDRLHLLKSQHQHAVASHRRSSIVNTGSPPSTP
ncbi:hypothetical protein HN51_035236, partial [Arachis hypogaea]